MAAEITAWFSDIDDAENAARELRKRGRGIRSLRIRQPKREGQRSGGQGPEMQTALAFYGTPLGQSYISGGGGYPAAGFVPNMFMDTSGAAGGTDGPAGRQECLMVVITEDGAAREDAALLTAMHGSHVHMAPRLPS